MDLSEFSADMVKKFIFLKTLNKRLGWCCFSFHIYQRESQGLYLSFECGRLICNLILCSSFDHTQFCPLFSLNFLHRARIWKAFSNEAPCKCMTDQLGFSWPRGEGCKIPRLPICLNQSRVFLPWIGLKLPNILK